MSIVLEQLDATPGVLGSLVCDANGILVAHAFPPAYDEARLRAVARAVVDRTSGLEAAVGLVGTVDLRFATARVVVRPIADGKLVLLCAPSANLQTVLLSVAGALRRLEALLDAGEPAPTPAPAAAPRASGALHRLVEAIDAELEASGAERFRLRGRIALLAGFALDLVDPELPDDPAAVERLRRAAAVVLGRPFWARRPP